MHHNVPHVVLLALTMFALPLLLAACGDEQGGSAEIKTEMDKVSYAIGVNIAQGFSDNNRQVNPDVMRRAILDVMNGNTLALADSEMTGVMEKFQTDLRTEQEAKYKADLAENTKKATDFLVENAKKDGVVTLEDSLQYEVLKEGDGPKPKPTDTVRVNYRGSLMDGTEFDSSFKRGEPMEFTVNNMIPGWVEILPMMSVGSHWKVYIPPKLAYGERSMGVIPPNALLIFEIELLEIVEDEGGN